MVLILGLYGTFNRVIRKISQTVLLIETVRFFILAWFFYRSYGTFYILSTFYLGLFHFCAFLLLFHKFLHKRLYIRLICMNQIDLKYANSIYIRVLIQTVHVSNRIITQTVRLIETVRLNLKKAISRSYGTFNRVVKENFRTVRLIQTVLIIESLEYLPKICWVHD